MKTLIFGAGFLGQRLASALPDAKLLPTDITDKEALRKALREERPEAVINAAGKTGKPNVDWCETHQTETYRVNVTGALLLAEACAEAGVYMLHLGSGCVFYGDSPDPRGWREDDFANPVSFYSRTKYAADLVLSRLPGVSIARLRMPIDGAPGSRNLITKLTGYREVVDVENSVSVVDDLVEGVRGIAERKLEGVFHVTNPGTMRHRDLLDLYRKHVDPSLQSRLISEDELLSHGLVAKPRSNCILQSERLAQAGIKLRPIDEALDDVMRKYAQATRTL